MCVYLAVTCKDLRKFVIKEKKKLITKMKKKKKEAIKIKNLLHADTP